MPDVFDTLDTKTERGSPSRSAGDVFDSLDVFDEIAPDRPAGIPVTEETRRQMAQAQPGEGRYIGQLYIPPPVMSERGDIAGAPDSELIRAVGSDLATNPLKVAKAIPETVLGVLAAPGKLAYLTAADLIAATDPEGGREYGGNLRASMTGEELPVDKFIGEVAKYDRSDAVKANLARALPELASMMVVNPQGAAGRLLAAGFAADQIVNAKPLFDEYAAEINKPENEQDAGKRAQLEAAIIQTFAFAPLAGGHAVRGEAPGPAETVARLLGRAELERSSERGVTPIVEPGGRPGRPAGMVTVEDLLSAPETQSAIGDRQSEIPTEQGTAEVEQAKTTAPPPVLESASTPEVVTPPETAAAEPGQHESPPAAANVVERGSPSRSKRKNLAQEYLSEQVNYGGEIRTRGELIAQWQKEGVPQKQIDAYMMGAKTLPPETPAAATAKVAQHVEEVKAEAPTPQAATRSAKEIKSELVQRLEQAIEQAPEETPEIAKLRADHSTAVRAGRDKLAASINSDLVKQLGNYAKKITIDIPGDGTFTVWKTKEALGQVLERAKKLDTSAGKPASVRYSGTSKADREWIQEQVSAAQQTRAPRTSAVGDPIPATPIPPTPAPAPAPGATMLFDARLPVTLPRSGEGSVSVPQVMQSLRTVQQAAGSLAGNIRTGRFGQAARGIFKPHEEIVRLAQADNIPTAVHEVGHALQKQLYGTIKASGLKVLPGDVRRELIGLGKALYGSRKPAAGYTGEGFAEFMRYWLTTEDAAKVAPKTTAFFESAVLPKFPDVANALANSRGLIDIWRRQGAVERARRQLVREPGAFARVAKAIGSLFTYQAQVESGAPFKAVSEAAALKLGKPLPPSQDPFKIYSFKRGSAGATVERMVMNHMLDVWGNPVGPSLAEAFAPVKGQRKEFGLYLFARAAEMRWKQGRNPGITLEDAQHIKTLYETPEFQLAAQKYFDWQNGLLDYVVQADPTMADTVAKMRGANDFYAPLARLIDPSAAKRLAATARSNPFMRMHGSGLPVKDIFDQTMINAARLVNRANRALVSNAVVKLAELPGLGHLIEEIPKSKVLEKVNIEKLRDQLEATGVDTSVVPPDELLQYYTVADAPKGSEPIIAVRKADGVHWYQVDPRLYESLDGLQTYSLKNAFPNLPGLGVALDLVAAAPSRLFKLGVTGLRAPFSLITNPARDLPTALVQSSVNPARWAAEYPAALGGVLRAGFGGLEGHGVQQFYDLGAHMGQPLGIDIGHTKRVSNELFHGRFLRTVLNPVDHLRQLFSITEAAPRVAELRAVADEVGWKPGTKMTPDQAIQMALAAKQVTVDFSAMGDVSRVINSAVPFYNPAIQGLRSFGRAFQQHPMRSTLLGLAAFTAPALINWWRNKDKEWYRAMPWRERYTYTNIDDGTNVWRIPRPIEWGNAFAVLPEAIMDSWYRHDPRAATEAMQHIFTSTNPLDLPVAAKVAKEQWQNRIDYWDRPIVPRSEEDLPPAMQVGPYTSKLAIAINRAFPNVSPRKADAALRGFFGGVYSDLVGGLGLTASQVNREREAGDLPVLGVLFRRGGEFNAQNQNISDFYDAYIPAKAKVEAARMQAKRQAAGQPVGNALQVTMADLTAAGVGEDASRAISALLRLANATRETRARQELYKSANEIAVQANTVLKNAAKTNGVRAMGER